MNNRTKITPFPVTDRPMLWDDKPHSTIPIPDEHLRVSISITARGRVRNLKERNRKKLEKLHQIKLAKEAERQKLIAEGKIVLPTPEEIEKQRQEKIHKLMLKEQKSRDRKETSEQNRLARKARILDQQALTEMAVAAWKERQEKLKVEKKITGAENMRRMLQEASETIERYRHIIPKPGEIEELVLFKDSKTPTWEKPDDLEETGLLRNKATKKSKKVPTKSNKKGKAELSVKLDPMTGTLEPTDKKKKKEQDVPIQPSTLKPALSDDPEYQKLKELLTGIKDQNPVLEGEAIPSHLWRPAKIVPLDVANAELAKARAQKSSEEDDKPAAGGAAKDKDKGKKK